MNEEIILLQEEELPQESINLLNVPKKNKRQQKRLKSQEQI